MNNIMQALSMLKGNPSAILGQFGVPINMMNNPQQIIQYLMNNGKISQDQYNNAVNQARNMGIKF